MYKRQGFTVSKVSNIDDAYLQVDYIDGNAFKSFATMVAGIQGKNLATFFGINESRPIPNIVAKELSLIHIYEKVSGIHFFCILWRRDDFSRDNDYCGWFHFIFR